MTIKKFIVFRNFYHSEGVLKRFFLLFLLTFSLYGEEQKVLPLADTDCDISAFVGGCVNAITGTFNDYEVDLVVPGTEPLVISRSYNNKCYGNCSLKRGWSHNHFSYLQAYRTDEKVKKNKKKTYKKISYVDPEGGSGCFYAKDQEKYLDFRYKAEFSDNRGMTNLGKGEISARTNPINTWFYMHDSSDHDIVLRNGAGEEKQFHGKTYWKGSPNHFILWQEKKSNGHYINYDFNKYWQTKEICLWNRDKSTCYASVSISDTIDEKLKKNPFVPFTCSDGRVIKYHFKKFKVKQQYSDPFPIYYLWKVERPNGVTQTYEYQHFNKYNVQCSVTKKSNPDGRYLNISYYGTNFIPTGQFNFGVRDQYQYRVKTLESPVGASNAPVKTHKFSYGVTEYEAVGSYIGYEIGICGGFTTVHDAYDRQRIYYYGTDQRLSKIEYYTGRKNHRLHRTMYNIWVDNDPLKGALNWRTLYDKNDVPICGRSYEYDGYGNILAEHFYGNLTGKNIPLQGTSSKAFLLKGAERYSIYYSYLKDGEQHLKHKEYDCRCKSTYTYRPGTDILEAKFFGDHHHTRIREYYHYDHNDSLIAKIVDDGSAQSFSDPAHVTQRHITRITPRKESPIGLPEVTQELYYDFETNQEVLLIETHRDYSREGWLLSEKTYDSEGNLLKEKSYEYDSMGNITKEINPLGQITLRQYDNNNNLIFEQTPQTLKRHTYDFVNRLICTDERLEGKTLTTRYRYDYCNNLIQKTDPKGTTLYRYNDFNQVEYEEQPPLDGGTPCIHREYDHFGNVTQETDSQGSQRVTEYTVRGQPTYRCDPDGTVERFTYTVDGLLETKTEKNGTLHTYTYDYHKRPLTIITKDSKGTILKSITRTYNSFHLLTETDTEGITTYYTYDAAGRKIEERRENLVKTFEYDALARPIKVKEGPRITRFTYDPLDRLIEETLEDEQGKILQSISYAYDFSGNVIQEIKRTQQGTAIKTTQYNAHNQPTLIEDALGQTTHFRYDYIAYEGKRVLSVTTIDPLGTSTQTLYNTLGKERIIEKKDPLGNLIAKTEIFYDSVGNPITEKHHTIQTKQIHTLFRDYDSMNRLVALTEAYGTPEQKITRYTYTSTGQQHTITKPNGVRLQHTYDPLDNLEHIESSDHTIDYHYTYNAYGLPTSVVDKEGRQTRRYYDSQKNLIQETLANNLTLSYQRDELGRITTLTLPDQTQAHFDYSALYLEMIIRHNQRIYYTYDPQGNVHRVIHPDHSVTEIQRDKLERITSVIHPHYTQKNLIYDAAGNLLSYQGTHSRTYTYDSNYQLQSEPGQIYTYDGLYNRLSKNAEEYQYNSLNQRKDLAYDPNGNLIRYQGKTLVYDALDRLIQVIEGDTIIHYTYDAFHRRIAKQTPEGIYTYFYQGDNEIGSYKNGKLQELRILGPAPHAEIFATALIELNNKPYYPLHDHTGSIKVLVDPKGYILETYEHTAYGEEEATSTKNPWRFQSKRVDPETGLIYFGRRYYAPDQGRWISQDPLSYEDGPNLYAYVKNNPLIYIDEYGLFRLPLPLPMQINVPPSVSRPFLDATWSYRHLKKEERQRLYRNEPINAGEVRVITIEGRKDPNKLYLVTNGIGTPLGYALESAHRLSKLLGGIEMVLIYNPTNGVINDTRRALNSLDFHNMSRAAEKIAEVAQNYIRNNLFGHVIIFPHSEGAINTREALISFENPEHRQQVSVIGIATAAYIDKDLCRRAVHINCKNDIVPYFDSIGMNKNRDTTIWLYNKKMKRGVHGMRCPIYDKKIVEQFNIFQRDLR
ncbi:MAG: hypothetical protein Tsb0021_08580 [Chlamydiales bacterium]